MSALRKLKFKRWLHSKLHAVCPWHDDFFTAQRSWEVIEWFKRRYPCWAPISREDLDQFWAYSSRTVGGRLKDSMIGNEKLVTMRGQQIAYIVLKHSTNTEYRWINVMHPTYQEWLAKQNYEVFTYKPHEHSETFWSEPMAANFPACDPNPPEWPEPDMEETDD